MTFKDPGLTSKAMAGIFILLIVTGSFITYYSIGRERELLTTEFEKRALSLAKSLANSCVLPVLTDDRQALGRLLKGIKDEADTVYVIVEDMDGKIISGLPDSYLTVRGTTAGMSGAAILTFMTGSGEKIYEAAAPVTIEVSQKGEDRGELFGLSEAPAGRTVEEKRIALVRIGMSPQRTDETMAQIRNSSIAITLAITLLTIAMTFFLVRVTIGPLSRLVEVTRKFSRGELDEPIEVTSGDEIGTLAVAMDSMRVQLKNLLRETVEKERMSQELLMARRVQLSLLPTTVPRVQGLELTGTCIPAKEVGGDYYDYIEADGGTLGVAVGDVAGKGVPAALMMSMVKGSFLSNVDAFHRPKEMIYRLNSVACKAEQKHITTFFYALLDPIHGNVVYSNAGHNFPYLYRKGALRFLEAEGWPLGVEAGLEYQEGAASLEKDDLLVFYTDGVVEAHDSRRKIYGYERFEEAIRRHSGLPLEKMKDALLREIEDYCGGEPHADDLTLLLVKIL